MLVTIQIKDVHNTAQCDIRTAVGVPYLEQRNISLLPALPVKVTKDKTILKRRLWSQPIILVHGYFFLHSSEKTIDSEFLVFVDRGTFKKYLLISLLLKHDG